MRSTWEARQSGRPGAEVHGKIHGGRAMPEAVLYSTGKPDRAGGPMLKYRASYTEAGLCRRPYYIRQGRLAMREAQYEDLRRHGRQYRPEALLGV